MLEKIIEAIPSNWCDPLLTGEDKVIGKSPYDYLDIENLLNAIRERIETIASQPENSADKKTPCKTCGGEGQIPCPDGWAICRDCR